jgi:hypothetical protein
MREVVLDQKLREGFVERTSSPLGLKCAIQYNCGRTMPSFVFVFIKGVAMLFSYGDNNAMFQRQSPQRTATWWLRYHRNHRKWSSIAYGYDLQ